MTSLDRLLPGQRGRVVSLADDSRVSRRLMELGLVPGREVIFLRDAPLHDPLEVRIGSFCLSLRRAEAALVAVEVED